MNESKRFFFFQMKYSSESCDRILGILVIPPQNFSQTNLPIQYYFYLKFSTSIGVYLMKYLSEAINTYYIKRRRK